MLSPSRFIVHHAMWGAERVRAALSEISYLAAWALFIATLVNKERDV
jgi:hypothetical protein